MDENSQRNEMHRCNGISILDMPDEVLVSVAFPHLDIRSVYRLGRTCRRFRAVVRDRRIWNSLLNDAYAGLGAVRPVPPPEADESHEYSPRNLCRTLTTASYWISATSYDMSNGVTIVPVMWTQTYSLTCVVGRNVDTILWEKGIPLFYALPTNIRSGIVVSWILSAEWFRMSPLSWNIDRSFMILAKLMSMKIVRVCSKAQWQKEGFDEAIYEPDFDDPMGLVKHIEEGLRDDNINWDIRSTDVRRAENPEKQEETQIEDLDT